MKRSAMICVAMLVAMVMAVAFESVAMAQCCNDPCAPRQGLFARARARRAAKQCCTPAPTCCPAPAPACCPAPEPVCCPAPAPVCAPAPTCCEAPAPTCCEAPAATCCDAAPTCCKRQGCLARRRARRSCNTGCNTGCDPCASGAAMPVSYTESAGGCCGGSGAVMSTEIPVEESAPVETAPAADVVPDAPPTDGKEA